ncbi:MAG: hypothetical protein AABY62_08160 [Pseudomonadota bacterium]
MKDPDDRRREFSAEHLNAFVDEQLAPEEKSRLLLSLNSNEALSREVCELRKVRDLVRLAYPEPSAVGLRDGRHGRRSGFSASALAATLATLTFGMMLGWFLHTRVADIDQVSQDNIPDATAAGRHLAGKPVVTLAATTHNPPRIILHVTESDPKQLAEMMNDLEGLLRHYKAQNQSVRVEVVTNGDGLALLRADVTPYARRIARLQEQYDNLSFVACQNTLDRLTKEKGITARLLPGVVIIDSGVAQLMRRQNQGWAYIQV